MSVRSSLSTENKGPVPFLGIPLFQTWQILGPAFPLGDCPLLPAPTIPSSFFWCPPSTNLAFVSQGTPACLQVESARRWGRQAAAELGAPRSGPIPGSPTRRDERRRRRPLKATGWGGAGGARPPGETARGPGLQPLPRSLPQAPAPHPPQPVGPPARTARSRGGGLMSRLPGQAARRPVATAVPRPARPGAAAAPRPGRDSWAPKGLSRRCSRPSPPRAAVLPRAGPSAHAPARYLRSRSRSSSTWPLSPGGRPSARPLGSAPRSLLAARTRPGRRGVGDYHILAYQRASRGLSSQWSLWKGGVEFA